MNKIKSKKVHIAIVVMALLFLTGGIAFGTRKRPIFLHSLPIGKKSDLQRRCAAGLCVYPAAV